MMAALPDDFVPLLLGSAVAAGSVLVAVSSLWAVARRHRAEEHFLTVLSVNMRETFTQAELQRLNEGELAERKKEDLREVIFGALQKLDDATDRDFIQKALKQPSPRGRENYERKILSEGARRALRELQTTDAAGKDAIPVEKQARPTPSEEPRPRAEQNEAPSLARSKRTRAPISVRHNVYGLSQDGPEISALRKGIAEMMGRPPSDPTSWRYQANIYGTDDTAPNQQVAKLWNQAPHANYFFLSWNRM